MLFHHLPIPQDAQQLTKRTHPALLHCSLITIPSSSSSPVPLSGHILVPNTNPALRKRRRFGGDPGSAAEGEESGAEVPDEKGEPTRFGVLEVEGGK
jgi:hypothetical protein